MTKLYRVSCPCGWEGFRAVPEHKTRMGRCPGCNRKTVAHEEHDGQAVAVTPGGKRVRFEGGRWVEV